MGMFDSFFFADTALPDCKTPANYEFQTKDLDCHLDEYHVAADGSVEKRSWNGVDQGKKSVEGALNFGANVYSHEFLYGPGDIMTRKYLGCKYQEYQILIKDSKLIHAAKTSEYGYDGEPVI